MLLQEVSVKNKRTGRLGIVSIKGKYAKRWKEITITERICSLKKHLFLLTPKRRKGFSVKASFCTSFKEYCRKLKKGSLAVETALVLPLFFLGMITIISFMDIYQMQTEHLSKLCTKAKQAGMYAYGINGSGTDEITLPDVYSYAPMGGLIPLAKVWTYNQVKVHAWTGTEYEGFQDAREPEKMVYVTVSGEVYHKNLGCSYLNLSVKQISGSSIKTAENKYGEHYSACEICSRNQNPAGCVFVTEQGSRYHNLESCSGLKRTVRLVKESYAEGKSCCSRCG